MNHEIRIWQHKETKKECRASPWWECVEPLIDYKGVPPLSLDIENDRKYKIGALIQVGWLLENEHGVWFGMGLDAANFFNDLGPYEPIENET